MAIIPVIPDAPSGVSAIAYLTSMLEKYAPVFFLIVARLLGLTLQAPFFSGKSVPTQVRATLIVTLAMMYMLTIQPKVPDLPSDFIKYSMLMIQEALIGVIFGFCASIIIAAIQAAGEILDIQAGLSMVTLFNPQTKTQSSATGRLFSQIELTVFIFAQGHLYLLAAFFNTFDLIPLGKFNFSSPIVIHQFINIASKLFYVSIQLALPVLIVLFIIDFSLGITNKVSPQINVLELNFAMKPTTSMIILLVIMSSLVTIMSEFSLEAVKDSITMTKVMGKAIRQEDARKAKDHEDKFAKPLIN
ncbi:MAG: flagellar biosynthetic protein FliR [Candidatus Sericytochromatia bacterium]|nr:flagellar biosynthetic protein FliR [Candidatus Sericytochromatia bacterium]